MSLPYHLLPSYYYDTNTDVNNITEVHKEGCSRMPDDFHRVAIERFSNCHDAISKAKEEYPWKNFDGCYYCCNECHTK